MSDRVMSDRMMSDRVVNEWATQSAVTDPGCNAPLLEGLLEGRLEGPASDVEQLLQVSRRLVFHYRAGGDFAANGIAAERIAEVDTRYVEPMLALLAHGGRLVGCCRDFTVLFVAMARHLGIPARARVGFATYFEPGWLMDHVIAEVWDEPGQRWRLVEPEIGDGHVVGVDGSLLEVNEVPANLFITGGRAWLMARRGELDPHRFVVAPDLQIPGTRGWNYLRHNLIHDLAAMSKREMLLWDEWGLMLTGDPSATGQGELLDELAALLAEPDPGPREVADWGRRDGFAVPRTVTSYSPAGQGPQQVEVSRAISSV